MLIRTPLPHGSLYPQLAQAPVTSYHDFLNHFRGGQTIDDNLSTPATQSTEQHAMFRTAMTSGHLSKQGSPLAALGQGLFLVDIFLTEKGAASIPREDQDRQFCRLATDEAKKSIHEDDGKPHPFVGAVVIKDGKVLKTGFRGETGKGRHAEYCALRKINDDVDNVDLSGCTVYTTLEPCSQRNSPNKTACATRLINAKVERVVYGLADKDETVYGHVSLTEAGIEIDLFPKDLIQELLALNKTWSDTRRMPEIAPSPNNTSPLANVSYNKPGTPMTDNTHFFVRPPENAEGFFTIEDISKNVLAWGKTIEEIASEWIRIQTQKVIVEKLNRQGGGSSDQRLRLI